VPEPGQLGDLPRGHGGPINRGTVLEHLHTGDRRLSIVAEAESLADLDGPGEHPHVRELLSVCASLHLEHDAGRRRARLAVGHRQEGRERAHQGRDARSRARRTEEHRVDVGGGSLRGELRPQLVG
jgi:hypothetical protein